MENENQNTNEATELVQEFPLLGELLGEIPSQPMSNSSPEAEPKESEENTSSFNQLAGEADCHLSMRGKAREEKEPPVPNPVPQLQKDLESALQRVQQLERERWLLSQGVPDEDLDYYAFKIGKLVTPEKDFTAAAKDYLKNHRGPRGISTGAGLSGRVSKAPGINDTMNRLIRGDS